MRLPDSAQFSLAPRLYARGLDQADVLALGADKPVDATGLEAFKLGVEERKTESLVASGDNGSLEALRDRDEYDMAARAIARSLAKRTGEAL